MVLRKRRSIVFSIVFMVVLLSIAVGLFIAKSSKGLTIHTSSDAFLDKKEKLDFMNKYIATFSEVEDAEYIIDYWDNSYGLVPGPSDWDMIVAFKVDQGDVAKWKEGFLEAQVNAVDLGMWDALQLKSKGWEIHSEPQFYKRDTGFVYLVVYEEEGILLKLISTTEAISFSQKTSVPEESVQTTDMTQTDSVELAYADLTHNGVKGKIIVDLSAASALAYTYWIGVMVAI